MAIQPLGDRIVVKVLEAKEITKGGIVLPDSAKEKPSEAKVVAVGKGRVKENGQLIPLEVKVGDHVLYGKYNGATEITTSEGEELMIIKEEDILAIVKK